MVDDADRVVDNKSLSNEDANRLLQKYIKKKKLTEPASNQICRSIVRFERELNSRTELGSILDLLDMRPLKATIISAGILGESIPHEDRGDIRVRHISDFIGHSLDHRSQAVNPVRGLVSWDQYQYQKLPSNLDLSHIFQSAETRTEVVILLIPLLSGITVSYKDNQGISSTSYYVPPPDGSQPVLAAHGRAPIYQLDYNTVLAKHVDTAQTVTDQTPVPALPQTANENGRLTGATVRQFFNRYEEKLDYSKEIKLDKYLAGEFFDSCAKVFNNTKNDVLSGKISNIRKSLSEKIGVKTGDISVDKSGIKKKRAETNTRLDLMGLLTILSFVLVSIQNSIRAKCTMQDPISVLRASWKDIIDAQLNTKGNLPVSLAYLALTATLSLLFISNGVDLAEFWDQVSQNPVIYAVGVTLSPLTSPWRSLYIDYLPGF